MGWALRPLPSLASSCKVPSRNALRPSGKRNSQHSRSMQKTTPGNSVSWPRAALPPSACAGYWAAFPTKATSRLQNGAASLAFRRLPASPSSHFLLACRLYARQGLETGVSRLLYESLQVVGLHILATHRCIQGAPHALGTQVAQPQSVLVQVFR